MKVLVIGAGITGLTTAYYLQKQGFDVVIVDEESNPAMKCSYANGGQMSVSNSEVWNTWKNVFKGVKWMFKKDAPLLIRPSLDLEKISWLAKFLYHTARNDYEKNTLETIRMGLKSLENYEEIIKETKIKFDRSKCGILHIYNNDESYEEAIKAGEIYESMGVSWVPKTPNECQSLTGGWSPINGIYTETDWTGDIKKFCDGLSNNLNLYYSEKYYKPNIEYYFSSFDFVVVCAGVGSKKIASYFGDNLPVYPVKGYSITIEEYSKNFTGLPKVSIIDDDAKIVTSTLGDRLRVAGTAEFNGHNYDIRKDRIDPLIKWSSNKLNIRPSKYSSWACLRPMTPNMLPIVRQSKKNPKVFYNTGHGHLGWTLAAYTAEVITNKIVAYDRYN